MAREEPQDLQEVKIGGGARQVDTFIRGRRVTQENTAMSLARTLSNVGKAYQAKQEIDIKEATDKKLHGSATFVDTYEERIADYENSKHTLRSMEDAEKYFLERTKEEFKNPYSAAGYEEKRQKALSLFRGQHAQYLEEVKVKERSDHLFKDYVATVVSDGVAEAEKRKVDFSTNFNISPKELNQMMINSAAVLLAQGNIDKAEEVVKFKRGAAGSLLDNPDTAIDASKILNGISKTRKDMVAAQQKAYEDSLQVSRITVLENERDFLGSIRSNEVDFAQKLRELNKMETFKEISTSFASSARRHLKANIKEEDKTTNVEMMNTIIQRAYDLNATSDRDREGYLRGMNELEVQIMDLASEGELTSEDEEKLTNRLATLTANKVSEASVKLARQKYSDVQKTIDSILPQSQRAEAFRSYFYATDEESLTPEDQKLKESNPDLFHTQKMNQVLTQYKDQTRQQALKKIKPVSTELSPEDTQYIKDLGYKPKEVKDLGLSRGWTTEQTVKFIRMRQEKINNSRIRPDGKLNREQ